MSVRSRPGAPGAFRDLLLGPPLPSAAIGAERVPTATLG